MSDIDQTEMSLIPSYRTALLNSLLLILAVQLAITDGGKMYVAS